MLVTNPVNRATLAEVLSHPWMAKGFDGPPDPHIPHREPLRPGSLDAEVIKKMTGFEFGTPEDIESKLNEVLTSDIYTAVLRAWDKKRGVNVLDVTDTNVKPLARTESTLKRSSTNKRFSGLDFYRKKIAGGLAGITGSGGRAEDGSYDGEGPIGLPNGTGANGTLNSARIETLDPTRGFHPLISIYFLVQEKNERERIYGPGVFASSTLSLNGPPPPPAPPSVYKAPNSPADFTEFPAPTKPPGAYNDGTLSPTGFGRSDMARVPSTPVSKTRYDYGSEQPASAGFEADGRVNGRRGELRVPSSAPNSPSIQTRFQPQQQQTVDERGMVPSLSVGATNAQRRSLHIMSASAPSSDVESSRAVSFDEHGVATGAGGGFARRFGSLLGRATSVSEADYKRHRHRSSVSGIGREKTPVTPLPQVSESAMGMGAPPPASDSQQDADVNGGVQRSSTFNGGVASNARHNRGVSFGGSVGRSSGGQLFGERRRQSSLIGGRRPRTADQEVLDEKPEDLPEVVEPEPAEEGAPLPPAKQDVGFLGRTPSPSAGNGEQIKPVYLKVR